MLRLRLRCTAAAPCVLHFCSLCQAGCRISYLAYIKVFVGLARDRLNGLLASPSATSVAHIRALALLAWIVTDNATWVMLHFAAFPGSDLTYRLLWLFDAVVITVEALQTATIYGEDICCESTAPAERRTRHTILHIYQEILLPPPAIFSHVWLDRWSCLDKRTVTLKTTLLQLALHTS